MGKYNLIVMSFDGDYQTELKESSFDECLNASENMGSKWIFYPYHFIVTAGCQFVREVPAMFDFLQNKNLKTVQRIFKKLFDDLEKDDKIVDVDEFADYLIFGYERNV